jgi:hypothetical protein
VPHNASWITLVCRFTAHRLCCNVLGGGGDISSLVRDLLDTLVCEVESSLGTKGVVCDEPYLQEVVECILALCNVTALGANGITTPLLKAGLEPIT